jgi:hypothetical protein
VVFRITWTPGSGSTDGFNVYRGVAGATLWDSCGGYQLVGTVPVTTTSYTDHEVEFLDMFYCFEVSAYNAAGESAPVEAGP